MMLKIGLLTYFRDIFNAGTNLQAYSTYKAIQNTFPEAQVELIDYQAWKSITKPYLSGLTLESLVNDWQRIHKYRKFLNENFTLSKNNLISSRADESVDFIKSLNYDCIFIGADTLLELDRAEKDKLTAFWLDPSIKCKKCLIAASAKNVTFEKMSVSQKAFASETIKDFSLLGVRDDSTYRLLSHFTSAGDDRLSIIPDPTFTLDPNLNIVEDYIKKKRINFDKPTICFHVQRHDTWASELAEKFKKLGYQIASFRPGKYADILLNGLSPLEQFCVYKYFKLVITHRFHDTIFCLLNKTPVITYPVSKSYTTNLGESKYASLLKYFRLIKYNYIENPEEITTQLIIMKYDEAMGHFIDNIPLIEKKITEHKNTYQSFLNRAREIVYR
jgi:hypothetical protein